MWLTLQSITSGASAARAVTQRNPAAAHIVIPDIADAARSNCVDCLAVATWPGGDNRRDRRRVKRWQGMDLERFYPRNPDPHFPQPGRPARQPARPKSTYGDSNAQSAIASWNPSTIRVAHHLQGGDNVTHDKTQSPHHIDVRHDHGNGQHGVNDHRPGWRRWSSTLGNMRS